MTLLLAALTSSLLAAPRTDGIYVPEAAVGIIDAPASSADELKFIEYLAFSRGSVSVHFFLETEKHDWRAVKDGLEQKASGQPWAAFAWREAPDGSVETDLLSGPLRFVKGSLDVRTQALERAQATAQLSRLAGRYGEGADAVVIDAAGAHLGKKAVALKVEQCFPGCASLLPSLCLSARDLMLLETPEGLLRLPQNGGLCTAYGRGVELEGGTLLKRAGPARVETRRLDPALVSKAFSARRRALARCNETKAAIQVKLGGVVGRAGLISELKAGESNLTDCIETVLSRLTFPTSAEATPFAVELELQPLP